MRFYLRTAKTSIFLAITTLCFSVVLIYVAELPFSGFLNQAAKADLTNYSDLTIGAPEIAFVVSQNNSLLPLQNSHFVEFRVIRRTPVIVTAYSSSSFETDDDPYLTAAGTLVRDGIIANNKYPFGTKIRLPELFGDKIFVVEDRMHWRKGFYQFDIWFSSYEEALNFGAKRTYIEVLEG